MLKVIKAIAGWPVKYGRVFLVPWKNTAMFNRSSCIRSKHLPSKNLFKIRADRKFQCCAYFLTRQQIFNLDHNNQKRKIWSNKKSEGIIITKSIIIFVEIFWIAIFIQSDHINHVCWYFVNNDLSSVGYCTRVQCTLYTGQVTFYKLPELHFHAKMVTL